VASQVGFHFATIPKNPSTPWHYKRPMIRIQTSTNNFAALSHNLPIALLYMSTNCGFAARHDVCVWPTSCAMDRRYQKSTDNPGGLLSLPM
jgi:hypothetical protein